MEKKIDLDWLLRVRVGQLKTFRLARLGGNDAETLSSPDMLAKLGRDDRKLAKFLRDAHLICTDDADVTGASVLQTLTDRLDAGEGTDAVAMEILFSTARA